MSGGFDIASMGLTFSIWVLPVLFAVTLHEAAHGWVAWKLGDDTAYVLGRVSFNPIRHIDPVGTILMPALLLAVSGGKFMFGYAKPVPVNPWRLANPRRDMVLVAAAGPAMNLGLAVGAALAAHGLPYLPPTFGAWVDLNLGNAVWINLLLFVFNMLPLPPLDGGRVAVGLLPEPLAYRLAQTERYGIFILLAALFILPELGRMIGVRLDIGHWLIAQPAEWLMGIVLRATGIAG